jgi:hypothetical protein
MEYDNNHFIIASRAYSLHYLLRIDWTVSIIVLLELFGLEEEEEDRIP